MIKTFLYWSNDYKKEFEILSKNNENTTGICILGHTEYKYDSLFNYNYFKSIISLANELDVPLYIITLYSSHYPPLLDLSEPTLRNVKVIYWPEAFLIRTYSLLCQEISYSINYSYGLDVHEIKPVTPISDLRYPFISMTKLPKPHRCLYMDLMSKYDLLKLGAVTWREQSNYDFKYWKEELLFLDQIDKDQTNGFNQEILPKEFTQSFMQVVPETDPNVFVLSEKTAIPLFFNKPFLTVGCQNFHATLEKMGYKLYNEIFDYSFDTLDNIEERYEGIVQNVNRICNKTFDELRYMYSLIEDKLNYNKLHALNTARNIDKFPNVWNEIALQQTGEYNSPEHFNNTIKQLVDVHSIKF